MQLHLRSRTRLWVCVLALCLAAAACQPATPTSTPQGLPTISPTMLPVPTLPPLPTRTSSAEPSTTEPGTPRASQSLSGQFAFVGYEGNVSLEDARTGNTRILVKNDSKGYAQSPAFSPDGKQVAFAYSSFTKDGQVQSQIRVINTDGTNDHVVLSPQDVKINVDLPVWSPDGKEIYITQIIPVGKSDQRAEIDRVPAGGGKPSRVIDNGFEAHLSPDGKRIVYQRLDFSTYAASLWTAGINGSGAKQLVDNATFSAMFGARFSPDAQTILFAASGAPQKKLPGIQGYLPDRSPASSTCLISILQMCWLEKAQAHGLPWDLWLVHLDAMKFERLTNMGADSPVPVWSPDGKFIVFFEASGIYQMDRTTRAIHKISADGGYGGFDWH